MNLQLFAQERTEAPTSRRLSQARQRGQVFKSMEVTSAFTLLAACLALQTAGPYLWAQLDAFTRRQWTALAGPDLTFGTLQELALQIMAVVALVSGPVLLASLFTGLLANYLQVGFLFTLQPLSPDLSRLNPLTGLGRLFSRRSLVELLKALLKVVIIGLIAYRSLVGQADQFPRLVDMPLEAVVGNLGRAVSVIVLRVGLAMLALALADYLYQRWEYYQSLRMTKQEVKEEHRETEGSPEVRARIRRKQRELARRRMMQEVPKADVVVVNPTHYAVALRYEPGEMEAPTCVAKGQGYLAVRIREIAREHDVPVVENPPLARSLYAAVDVGDVIPPELYQAVAEVLAYVYRVKGRLVTTER